MEKIFLISILSGLIECHAAVWYVTPTGAGDNSGSSWANAFAEMDGIDWEDSVMAGDTLYVGAGNYAQVLSPGSGTAGKPITIRAAQDRNTGVASFSTINMSSAQWVTFNGNYSGVTNFSFGGSILAQSVYQCKFLYFTMVGENPNIAMGYAYTNEIGYFSLIDTNGQEDTAGLINNNQDDKQAIFDQFFVHDGYIQLVRDGDGTGLGSDGIETGNGLTISNCTFIAYPGDIGSNQQHQDFLQVQNGYLRVLNCTFIDTGNSMIDVGGDDAPEALHIYNNLFLHRTDIAGAIDIRIYAHDGSVSSATDIKIDNNTFIDSSIRSVNGYGDCIYFGLWTSSTGSSKCEMQNNIFYNCGNADNGHPPINFDNVSVSQSGWQFSHNLCNAGSAGDSFIGAQGWSQTSGQSGAPSFVSYMPYAATNNLHLALNDTAASGNGTNLYALFTFDKDGSSRPTAGTWDIGAYIYSNSLPIVTGLHIVGGILPTRTSTSP
jgi:hypothetical protein